MILKENTPAEEKWKLERRGRFTASPIDNLRTPGKGTMFGAGADSYIKQVAIDAYTLFEDRNVQTYAMMMGKVNEPQAFAAYTRLVGFPGMQYYGGGNPVFRKMGLHAGGSPDAVALLEDGTCSYGAELKCPNRDTHWDYLTEIKDQWDLLRIKSDYYSQCQFLMKVYGCDLWHWVSYNEFYPFKDQVHMIEVGLDKRWQDDMEIRLHMAIKKKLELIEQMKNRK